jgi:hypothetical protein
MFANCFYNKKQQICGGFQKGAEILGPAMTKIFSTKNHVLLDNFIKSLKISFSGKIL